MNRFAVLVSSASATLGVDAMRRASRALSPGRFSVGMLVVAALVGMVGSPVFGQWGGGGGGGRNNNQQVGEAILGGLILGAAINEAMQPPRRPNYQSNQYYPSRPQQYYPSRPQPQYIYDSQPRVEYSRPSYSQPTERIISSQPVERVISSGETIISSKPVETVVATPKPNIVKDVPKANDSLKSALGATLGLNGGSAVDPLLAVSAQEGIAGMTDAVSEFVAASGSDEMKADWQKVVDGGSSPDGLDAWWKKHGPAINDPVIKALGPVHVAQAKLVQDLKDGLLSGAGKKAAIDKIAELVATLPAGHPQRADLVKGVAQMRQFQKLGDLLALASVAPMPLVPIMQGVTAMGLPTTLVAEVIELPLMQYPVGDAEPLSSGVTIRIVNPSTNSQTVNCSIGGRQVEMDPGSAESLTSSTSVAFDPGNGSRKSVSVSAGTWSWKLEQGLWNLAKVNPEITIDNAKFKGVFHYTVNGKQASLAAGKTEKHSGAMPIEISFDRGNGSGTATKILTFGAYAVGVDTSSNGLDLFRTDVQLPPPPSASAASAKAASGPLPAPTSGDRVRKALESAEKQKELSKLLQSLEREKQ